MEKNTLSNFIDSCLSNIDSVEADRKEKLDKLVQFIQTNIHQKGVPLVFICTHNSRRSFFAQVWAQVAAHHFGLNNIITYSGGTSETAIYKSTISALAASGLITERLSDGHNPVYAIRFDDMEHPVIGFSKTFDHQFNPSQKFAAIMTCSDADANCPFIPTASARIPLTYIDPKQSDGTAQEAQVYLDKSIEIATEMFYVFNQINK